MQGLANLAARKSQFSAFFPQTARGSLPTRLNYFFAPTIYHLMICTTCTQPERINRTYDHRLKLLVRRTGKVSHALAIGVPRSTARGWLKPSDRTVVSLQANCLHLEQLELRVVMLQRRNRQLLCLVRILVVLLKLSGFSLKRHRIPAASDKQMLLKAIAKTNKLLQLDVVLGRINLSRHATTVGWPILLLAKAICPVVLVRIPSRLPPGSESRCNL